MQGEFYNIFCTRMKRYLLTKSMDIVKANANVIYEGGYDFYIDEGLMNKFLRLWEEPAEDEIDVIYDGK